MTLPRRAAGRVAGTDGSEIIDLLARMVRVNSVLPHEEDLAKLVADELQQLGVDPVWAEVLPGRPNVYAVADLGPAPAFVTFTGHLDTVPPARDWASDPFVPVVRDGRMYGLGAVDMKSGLACALHAFKRLLEARDLHASLGRIGFAATVDEEGLGLGATALLRTALAQSDLFLLTEPFHGADGTDPIPLAITGKVLLRVRVRGRTTHGFTPERGVNAVEDASRIVAALDQWPLASHPVLGSGNYATLKIEGGYREYAVVVPEECEVVITRLTVPGETREVVVRQLTELIATLGLASEVVIETPPPAYEPVELHPEHPAVAIFRRCYREVLGTEPVLGGKRGIVDGNIYMAEGRIPTVTFGPKGAGLHEAGEYVELASLEPVTRILVDTAVEFSQTLGKEGAST